MIRDILANETPSVLTDGRLYMLAALVGAAAYILLLQLDISPVYVLWIPIVTILALRWVSLRYNLGVPRESGSTQPSRTRHLETPIMVATCSPRTERGRHAAGRSADEHPTSPWPTAEPAFAKGWVTSPRSKSAPNRYP